MHFAVAVSRCASRDNCVWPEGDAGGEGSMSTTPSPCSGNECCMMSARFRSRTNMIMSAVPSPIRRRASSGFCRSTRNNGAIRREERSFRPCATRRRTRPRSSRSSQGCTFSRFASIATNFSMRAARVSGFFAVWTRNRIA
jgi:hypothetical protein